jgi:oligopeptide/dipeptide ABC transporter ATP-binding protein
MADSLLAVRSLQVALGQDVVLQDVSFSVERGECMALVGETGSGKTMTTRVITGLLGRSGGRVIGGDVRFDHYDLVNATDEVWKQVRGRRIGLVPQSSLSSLNPVIKVGRQLRETVRVLTPDQDLRRRSAELLDMVRLPKVPDVMRLYPHELSGGMRQRVMIALALAGSPDLLIADEATTALDTTIQRGILDLISELRVSAGLAVLFVTHDLGLVRRFTDTVAVMYSGSVVESGPTVDVLENASHPYTQALIAATPSAIRHDRVLLSIAGAPPSPRDRPVGCAYAPRCPHAMARCIERSPVLEEGKDDRRVSCWLVNR